MFGSLIPPDREMERLGYLCGKIITERNKDFQDEYREMFVSMCLQGEIPMAERVNEILKLIYSREREENGNE